MKNLFFGFLAISLFSSLSSAAPVTCFGYDENTQGNGGAKYKEIVLDSENGKTFVTVTYYSNDKATFDVKAASTPTSTKYVFAEKARKDSAAPGSFTSSEDGTKKTSLVILGNSAVVLIEKKAGLKQDSVGGSVQLMEACVSAVN